MRSNFKNLSIKYAFLETIQEFITLSTYKLPRQAMVTLECLMDAVIFEHYIVQLLSELLYALHLGKIIYKIQTTQHIIII